MMAILILAMDEMESDLELRVLTGFVQAARLEQQKIVA
jgi:hypothetical protein